MNMLICENQTRLNNLKKREPGNMLVAWKLLVGIPVDTAVLLSKAMVRSRFYYIAMHYKAPLNPLPPPTIDGDS